MMQQQELPFREAEANFAERKNTLGLALLRVRCDKHLADFCLWIFNVTDGGTTGTLKKTYEELAARPWGLCCSYSKARATAARARHLGLVVVTEHRYVSFGQAANEYAIHWDGVREILRGLPPVLTRHPGALIEQGGALIEQPFKEYNLSCISLISETGPEAAPKTAECFRGTDKGHSAIGLRETADGLSVALVGQSPILQEAAGRRLNPMPPSRLVHGVWAPIEPKHLAKPFLLVEWHRRQLSTVAPVMGDSEADLLLTIAAAKYAATLPDSEVRKNRVAVFCATISRKRWSRVLPHVPAARKLLDEAASQIGAEWLVECKPQEATP